MCGLIMVTLPTTLSDPLPPQVPIFVNNFEASVLFSQLTFSDVCQPTFSKLFHMTWLYSKKKRCYADFLKVPLSKKGENPKISPNLASNRNILCAVTRNVEGK